jgi:nucleoid-associated protein YgaU
VITPTEPAVIQTTPVIPTIGAGTTTPGTTPSTQQTPAASPTQAPAGETPAASGTTTYTVQSGDTLFAICANLSSLDPAECVDRVLEINSITDPGSISPGETLTIPQ